MKSGTLMIDKIIIQQLKKIAIDGQIPLYALVEDILSEYIKKYKGGEK